jgi:predicted N-acetyltransferase YhbS
MEFRFAEVSDLEPLMALINRAFVVERFFKREDRLTSAATRTYFDKGRFLLAEDQGVLVGGVYVELRGERAYLGLLSVAPSHQKAGLGRRLTAAVEEFAREQGARYMDLGIVNLRQELPALYARFGYTVTGTEPIPAAMEAQVSMPCHFVMMSKALGDEPPHRDSPSNRPDRCL